MANRTILDVKARARYLEVDKRYESLISSQS
jgi:hypothetical protein